MHLQAVRHALAEDDAHALVVGDLVGVDGADGAEQRIRPARVDRARSREQRRVVVEAAVQVVGMRAEILQLETAAVPQLAFQAGAPLIHAGRGLMPGIGDDQCPLWRAVGQTPGEPNGLDKRGRREPSRPGAGKNRGVRRIGVQERVAVGLVRIVVDAAAGAEHGLLVDAVGESQARRPVVVVGCGEVEAGRAAHQARSGSRFSSVAMPLMVYGTVGSS